MRRSESDTNLIIVLPETCTFYGLVLWTTERPIHIESIAVKSYSNVTFGHTLYARAHGRGFRRGSNARVVYGRRAATWLHLEKSLSPPCVTGVIYRVIIILLRSINSPQSRCTAKHRLRHGIIPYVIYDSDDVSGRACVLWRLRIRIRAWYTAEADGSPILQYARENILLLRTYWLRRRRRRG